MAFSDFELEKKQIIVIGNSGILNGKVRYGYFLFFHRRYDTGNEMAADADCQKKAICEVNKIMLSNFNALI